MRLEEQIEKGKRLISQGKSLGRDTKALEERVKTLEERLREKPESQKYKPTLKQRIKRVKLSDGRTGYYVTEHTEDGITVYLVYPKDSDYTQVEEEYRNDKA
jgi:hypothetical protein